MFGIKFVRYPASIMHLCHTCLITTFKTYSTLVSTSDIADFLLPYIDIGPKNPILARPYFKVLSQSLVENATGVIDLH